MLARKCIIFRKIVSGQPVIVISPEGINYDALKKLNMNLHDLQESLRQCNYFYFDQIQYAIVETNGKISVVPKSEYAPATAQDVNTNIKPAELPILIITDGKMMKDNLDLVKINENKLAQLFKQLNIAKVKDVVVMSLDSDGKLYYQLKNQAYKVIDNINTLSKSKK